MKAATFTFACPNCDQRLEAESDMEGTTIDCPACKKAILIPTRSPAPKTKKRKPLPVPVVLPPGVPEREPYEGKATLKQKAKLWHMGYHDQSVIDSLGKNKPVPSLTLCKDRETGAVVWSSPSSSLLQVVSYLSHASGSNPHCTRERKECQS